MRIAVVIFALAAAATSHATGPYFSGNAFFSQLPTSQMGPIVLNNLFINNGPFSITVSGQIKVQIPPGFVSGTLLEWNVDRHRDSARQRWSVLDGVPGAVQLVKAFSGIGQTDAPAVDMS